LDLQSLFFVLVVIAIGGFSAYLADILGYKIGKKRLSIKRIRPKYVARISVVIAGMIIPIITMLLLYGVSSTFRTWITRGSEIVRDLEQKSKEVDKVNDELVKGEQKNASLANANKILDDQNTKKQIEFNQQQAKAKELNTKVGVLNKSITSLNATIASIRRDKEVAQSQLAPLKSRLETIQKQVAGVQKDLNSARSSLEDAKTKLKDASTNYNLTSAQNLKLTSQNGELLKKNDEIQKASDSLQLVVTNLTKDLEILKSQKSTAEAETSTAKANLETALKSLETIKSQVISIVRDSANFYRLKAVSYLRGEELSRVSIPAHPSQSDALSAYRAVLRRAKAIAADHGAKPDIEVYPFSGTAGSLLFGNGQSYMTEEEVEKFWVDAIRKQSDETVLIAKAAENRFETEPVTLEIDILPNPIVFRKGEIVTESKIDGRSSEIEILNGIREFLRTYVNIKARSRKMIPVQSRDGESFGEFTQGQLLSAVAKVKAVPRQLRLVAVAQQDIRAGEPLAIEIEVR
jgi:uncharacterized protein (DUF3084 family)